MLKWYELSIETNSMAVDAISEFLVMNGASGIAVHDPFEYQYLLETQNKNLLMGDFKKLEECVILKAYFSALDNKINIKPKLQDEDNPFIEFEYQLYDFANRKDEYLTIDELEKFIADKLIKMKSYLDPAPATVSLQLVKEEDWANDWKKYYKAIYISDKILVSPSWEDVKPKDGQILLKLDPGSAFGTGSHETTFLCLQAIGEYLKKSSSVLDVGTGSGILSIAADLLGAKEVLALNLDELALLVAKENIIKNDCKNIKLGHGTASYAIDKYGESYFDLVIANILAEVLVDLKEDLIANLKDEAYLILSGIINNKEDMVRSSFDSELNLVKREELNDWLCFIYQKKSKSDLNLE